MAVAFSVKVAATAATFGGVTFTPDAMRKFSLLCILALTAGCALGPDERWAFARSQTLALNEETVGIIEYDTLVGRARLRIVYRASVASDATEIVLQTPGTFGTCPTGSAYQAFHLGPAPVKTAP